VGFRSIFHFQFSILHLITPHLTGGRLPPLHRHKLPFSSQSSACSPCQATCSSPQKISRFFGDPIMCAAMSLPLGGEGWFCQRQNSDEGKNIGRPRRVAPTVLRYCHSFSGRCGHRPLHHHKSPIQKIFCNYFCLWQKLTIIFHFQFSIFNFSSISPTALTIPSDGVIAKSAAFLYKG